MSNCGLIRPQEAARAIQNPKLLTVIDQIHKSHKSSVRRDISSQSGVKVTRKTNTKLKHINNKL